MTKIRMLKHHPEITKNLNMETKRNNAILKKLLKWLYKARPPLGKDQKQKREENSAHLKIRSI